MVTFSPSSTYKQKITEDKREKVSFDNLSVSGVFLHVLNNPLEDSLNGFHSLGLRNVVVVLRGFALKYYFENLLTYEDKLLGSRTSST